MTTEIQWRRRWRADLNAKPWQQICIDEKIFLIKFHVVSQKYEFLITDQASLWHEELCADDVKKRSADLNPSVEAPINKLLDHIKEYIDNTKKAKFEIAFKTLADERQKAVVTLTTKLAGLPFVWKFHGHPAPSDMYKEQLTLPLLLMIGELQRQNSELMKLLRSKDKEIDDHKAQGSRVTRKHLETAPFEETVFRNNMLTSQGFTDTVESMGRAVFDSEGRELYQNLMEKHAFLTRTPHDDLEGESLLGEAETTERETTVSSWDNSRIPASLVATGTTRSPAVSPQVSPVKPSQRSPIMNPVNNPAPEASPSQDTELLRRQALEQKLQEEAERKEQKAKKKKKIKF